MPFIFLHIMGLAFKMGSIRLGVAFLLVSMVELCWECVGGVVRGYPGFGGVVGGRVRGCFSTS